MAAIPEELDRIGKIPWPRPFEGLRGITRADLPREIFSGFTLAALVIPLNIGYAQVAGLPAAMGLYAAIIPLVIFALFTTSRHVVGGPGPAVAALVAAALLAFSGGGEELRIQNALALALMCSLLFFLAWIFRLGYLGNFLSRAVLLGFVSGLGIQVFTNQARKILGVSIDTRQQLAELTEQVQETFGIALQTEGYFLNVTALLKEVPHANLYAVAIGLGSLVIVRLLKRYAPKIPGALVALILMTAIVAMFKLDEQGVRVLGALPSGFPPFTFPDVPPTNYLRMLPGAVALVAITLCEGLLVVRSYAQKYGYKADGDQVLFAYGVANATAGLSGSMVTGNSVSRSAAMDNSGAKSQLPSLVAAGVVTLVLVFFTDVLALLPTAALAGLVANAVISLVEVGELRALHRMRRSEFWIATVCLLSVLIFGPLRAVVIAFLLSIIDLIRRASRPHTVLLRVAPDGDYYIPGESDHDLTSREVIVYRFGASLYFANSNLFLDEVEKLVAQASTSVKCFVLDAHGMVDMDTTGAEALRQVLRLMNEHGVTFSISRASHRLQSSLKDYGLLDQIGEKHIFDTNRAAAAAFSREEG